MLKLIEFIKQHPDWENLLQLPPYSLHISRKDNFILLAYNMIESDFSQDIVKECRGIILEDKTFKIVCCPFFKFFNYGEGHAAKIDWATARVQEKCDGSILKLWYHNNSWRVSTNGTIDASDAGLQTDFEENVVKTYLDLFKVAAKNSNLDYSILNTDYTYMFELISPLNKIVVPYTETALRHIGTRDNISLQELNVDIGIKKPEEYSFSSFDEVLTTARALPFQQEGYVVVDANWNRVKVKSLAYLSVHHLRGNGVINKKRVLDLIKMNELEVLVYYPEWQKYFDEIQVLYDAFLSKVKDSLKMAESTVFPTRKDYAMWAKTMTYPAILFAFYDKKVTLENFKSYINLIPSDKLLEIIEK